ncbi:MAG: hypothetical protein ABWX90_02455, partial [Candidatus Saccharimonadales bacterium]
MHKVTQSSIETLARPQSENVISIYLPTHRHATALHRQEDQTRYKNLIRDAKEKWLLDGNNSDLTSVFKQLEAKLDNIDLWQHTTEAMAIFAGKDTLEIFNLPIECDERIHIGDSYDITPLLIVAASNQPYYLLNLAMHNTKLLKGDAYGLEPVAIDFPTSPEDALNIDEMFSGSNTVRSQNGPGGNISPHGQGDSNDAGREERLQYFRIIERMIMNNAEIDHTWPVLIAATDSEAGDYRTMSKLPTLVHSYLPGNHSNTTLPQLSALAWTIIQSDIINKRTADMMDQLNEKAGVQKSSYDYKDMTEAANTGRVKTLLVGITRKTTDTVSDAVHSAVPILSFAKQPDYERIAELVKKVIAQGGNVLGVGNEMLPAK